MDNNPINLMDVDGDCTDCKTKGLKKGNIVKDKKGNSWLYWGKNNDNKPEWYPLLPEVKISAPRKKSNLFKNAWSSVKQAASWFVNKIGELDVNLAIESSILNVAGDAIDNYRKGKKWVTITSDLWEGLGAVFQRLPKLKLQEGKRKYVDPTERQTREKKPDVIEKQTKQLEVLSETPKKAPDKDKLNNDLKSSNNQIHNKPNVENEVQSILIEEDKVGGVYDKNHLIKETGGNDLILSQSNGKINDEIIYLFRIQMKKTATYKYYKRAENSVNIIRISEKEYDEIGSPK